jgi:outer membrane protein assembly factor BamB
MRRLTVSLISGCVSGLVLVLATVGCSSAHETASPRGVAAGEGSFTDWTTYHGTPSRAGAVPTAPGNPLHQAWVADLDGAVYGEPLVIGSTLIVATESNKVYGLSARTGHRRWSVRLGTPQPLSGLPCGDIDPLGITGTPAYDAATGSVFVVAETVGGHHTLWALNAANGHRRWHHGLDLLPDRNRSAEQERSALLVAAGRVIVSFGGLAGDCDDYVGYVTSTPLTGTGRTTHSAVPTAREAGIWSPAGPVLGADGNVYVASGNGAELGGTWDHSDSVIELTPRTMRPVSIFAPTTWAEDNQGDLDLGTSSPAMVPSVRRIVIAGKRGTVYLLRQHSQGIGSEVAAIDGCSAFGGTAVTGTTVLFGCLFQHQVKALEVGKSGLRWLWSASGLYGSPVVAGRFVYVADRDSGDLAVLRLSDGSLVQRLHAGSLTHFPSEVVSGGFVYVPTLDGVTAFRG